MAAVRRAVGGDRVGDRLRVGPCGQAPSAASVAGLTLTEAERQPRGGGETERFAGPVVLRPGSILAGYDLGQSRSAPHTQYERQRRGEAVRVRVYLEGHLALECDLAGGLRSIDAVRGETFVACTNVELQLASRQRLPFLAINSTRVESFSVVSGAATAEDG